MNKDLVQLEHVPNILKELEDAFFDIPFENSDFQTKAFVIASQQTPGRAYRAIGLRMHSKIQAVQEYVYQQELNNINIDEKQAQLEDPDINVFEKRRIELELKRLQSGGRWGEKLLNDALQELTCLYKELKRLPKFDKQSFEAEEELHFTQRLNRALQAQGAAESLLNMAEDMPNWEARIAHSVSMIEGLKRLENQ